MDLSDFTFFVWIAAGIAALIFISKLVSRSSGKRAEKAQAEITGRMEALFRASFPELQPHFHPARVHEYVAARRARKVEARRPFKWKSPPGFPAAAEADIQVDGERENVRLLDAAGGVLAAFAYDDHAEGGVIRLGKGKFTASIVGPEPRVKYWHPQREFKWTPRKWTMQTGVADSSLESSSSSSHDDSYRSSSSTSSTAAAAAAGAGIVAAGGAFDGGGASAAWDDGGGSSSGGGGTSDFGNVSSGSSSSSSTSY